jgi:hypothetical protein
LRTPSRTELHRRCTEIRTWVIAHRTVDYHEQCPRVCMSSFTEGMSRVMH